MVVIPEWEPVSIVERRVVGINDGLATIDWLLGGGWTPEWSQSFKPQGQKKGSGAFALSDFEPRTTNNRAITWTVPEDDWESADSYVRQSIEATNTQYQILRAKQNQVQAIEDSREQTRAESISELQRKLDGLN